MKRGTSIAVVTLLLIDSVGPVPAQDAANARIIPTLNRARETAEREIKTLHAAVASNDGVSISASDVAEIDRLYSDLATSMNGFIKSYASAISNGRVDNEKWLLEANATLSKAKSFDNAVQKLATPARLVASGSTSRLLATVIGGGRSAQAARGYLLTGTKAERNNVADVLLTETLWRELPAVLGPT